MLDKEGIENKYVIKLRGKIYIITLRGKIYIEYKIIINKLGITLDAFNSKRFQFDVLWKMVVAFLNQFKKGKTFQFEDEDVVAYYNSKISITKDSKLLTKKLEKIYKCVNTKGIIDVNTSIVYPFGYREL